MTIQEKNDLSIVDRIAAPTPKFFKKVRTFGLVLGAIGAAIIGSAALLPAAVVGVAGYLITAGSVIVSVSSVTVDFDALEKEATETKKWFTTK